MLWVSGKMLLLPQRSFKQRWHGSDVTHVGHAAFKAKAASHGMLGLLAVLH